MTLGLKAQSDVYLSAMKNGLANLDTLQSNNSFISAANTFERIAEAEPEEWLPLYYAAYTRLLGGVTAQNKDTQDALYDQALASLKKAEIIMPNNSEIYALKGYALYMKMAVDPMERYQSIASAEKELEKALAINPSNPRVYLIRGQNKFYTPETYGGGKDAAKPLLLKAKELFETSKPAHELDPHWGKERTLYLLNQ